MNVITISNKLKNIFSEMNINSIIYSDINYLDIDNNNDNFITFIPTNKINKNIDIWTQNRNKMKIGKFFKKIFFINDVELEYLVQQYKTIYNLKILKKNYIFETVSGDKIWKYYQRSNYYLNKGTLSNSCMTQSSMNKLELYTKNKNVQLLIIKKDNKILSRALLWKLTDNTYYIDRPYTIDPVYNHYYRIYADIMNYKYYFLNQNDKMNVYIDKLTNQMPYLDTFKYLKSHILTNK